jgi:hypothetical protein
MTNNTIENLERVTHAQNTRYAYRDGRIGSHYKLNPLQRTKVVELYRTGRYHTHDLAKQFGVSRDCIGAVLKAAGVALTWRRKLTPAQYDEIRSRWVPHVYSVSKLARDYKVSSATVEYILGMRSSRGVRLSSPSVLNHSQEKDAAGVKG